MNERYSDDFEKINSGNPSQNQEIKTSQNLETIEKLFGEWDDEDKNTSESFSLNNQNFDNGVLSYEPKVENDYNPSNIVYTVPTKTPLKTVLNEVNAKH